MENYILCNRTLNKSLIITTIWKIWILNVEKVFVFRHSYSKAVRQFTCNVRINSTVYIFYNFYTFSFFTCYLYLKYNSFYKLMSDLIWQLLIFYNTLESIFHKIVFKVIFMRKKRLWQYQSVSFSMEIFNLWIKNRLVWFPQILEILRIFFQFSIFEKYLLIMDGQ